MKWWQKSRKNLFKNKMSDNGLIYKIGLTQLEGIGNVLAKNLVRHCGSAEAVFKEKTTLLEKIYGFGKIKSNSIKKGDWMKKAEKEIKFISEHQIEVLFFNEANYPYRLQNCHDSPLLLYYKGIANLNADKIVSIVGTRTPSEYGKEMTKKLIAGLMNENLLIVSGLAYGVDGLVHEMCLSNQIETVGVVGHGLDRIYPQVNYHLADKMKNRGGLLSEFMSGTSPDRENFPKRNRIVAGICDALVVIESKTEGGSLITAEIATTYNKDVFAIPGRIGDETSEGCNLLIKRNKAALLESASDLLYYMNWNRMPQQQKKTQLSLAVNLSEEESRIVEILKKSDKIHIDTLSCRCEMPISKISSLLMQMELNSVIKSLPGKFISLVH